MTRSNRLLPLVASANERIEESARKVAAAREVFARQEARLAELMQYRQQYEHGAAEVQPMRSFSVANSRAFQAQLDEAVRQQESRVTAAREDVERMLDAWSKLRREARAMEQLVERFVSDERRQVERVEQRHADDSTGTRKTGRGPVE
ncbi:MAG: flagellar export protein FliJ [Steroidobacteraceae bacterium]